MDDETSVLLTLQLVFEDDGYAIVTATSEQVALQVLRNPAGFDAVLTDMSMEHDKGGLIVAHAAALLRPRPVIVIFTGFGTIENVKGALGTSVDHFALKPIDVDDFKRVLARLLALRNDRLTVPRNS